MAVAVWDTHTLQQHRVRDGASQFCEWATTALARSHVLSRDIHTQKKSISIGFNCNSHPSDGSRYIQKLLSLDLEGTRLPDLLVTIIFLGPEGLYRLRSDAYSKGQENVSLLSP